MTAGVNELDAVPLVRGEAWEQFAIFYTDPDETARENLTGNTVTAEIRWTGGEQAVTVVVTSAVNGEATLSLLAADTEDMPLGRLATLYLAIDSVTWAKGPVEVQEGI